VALIDRTRELSVLTGLLEDAQAGNSAAMVLLGEPGIGETVLLEAVSGSADAQGMTTAHVSGIESEAPLGYAALHRLIRFFPGAVDRARQLVESPVSLVFPGNATTGTIPRHPAAARRQAADGAGGPVDPLTSAAVTQAGALPSRGTLHPPDASPSMT
jgi:hypothetical protein